MKKLLKYFLIILLAACIQILSACDDYLEREPLSELSPNTFFGTKGDMRTWMAGVYDALQDASLGANAFALEWGDLRSDNYGHTGYGETRVYLNDIGASQAQYNWEYLYRVIDRCNVAIMRFPTIPNVIPADYNDYVGQCYGLRALMYFYAIRVWGDVPLVTEPWDGGDVLKTKISRTPVSDVKAQILNDISKALELLSPDVVGPRKLYFNKAAAWALKTDLHMWFKEYSEALAASEYFINNTNYALVANAAEWKNMFMDPTATTVKETIFTIAWSSDPTLPDGTNQWAQRVGASNTNNTYRVSRTIFNDFVDRLRSGKGKDGRFWNALDTIRLSNSGGKINNVPVAIGYNHYGLDGTTKNIKFSVAGDGKTQQWVVISTTNCTVQLPVYRFADVLTLRAEAYNKLGNGAEAIKIVNSIRKRVGYLADANTEVDVSNVDAIENMILKERQLEFMGEGKRWFDLMRTGKVIEVMDPIMRQRQDEYKVSITGFGDPGRMWFPIYFKEFEANPALSGNQNPPYSEG